MPLSLMARFVEHRSAILWGLLLGGMCCLGAPIGSAVAQSARPTYEGELLASALQERGLELDPAPEGKRIAFVELVRDEVFLERDGLLVPIVLPASAPTWPNAFHWLTCEDVIRRELLLEEGQRYHEARAQESMRILRGLGIFALVRIVAVRGPEPESVGLLVYTRDLWSLRTETGFSGNADALYISGQLTERNLFGQHKQVSASFSLSPKTFSLGEAYGDRRLFGERLSLEQALSVIWNRDSGRTEGSAGSLDFGRPFYRLADDFSWGASAVYSVSVARELKGSQIDTARYDQERELLVTCEAVTDDCMRLVWDSTSYALSLSATYRRGEAHKQSFTLGAAFSDAEVSPNAETALRQEQRELFESRVLPRVRRQAYPYVRYGLSLPSYAIFENLATFGQSETVAVGPGLSLYVSFPLRAFGSSSDSMRVSASSGYVIAEADALAQLVLSGATRLEDGSVLDQSLGVLLRGATPPWLLGRLVGRAQLSARRRDSSNARVSLGVDTGLRGYPAASFSVLGGSLMRGNLEYRSLPVDIASIHLGGVLFYDTGTVYNELSELDFHHSAGVGLRLLFPQFNRYVFRFDAGVPLDAGGFAVEFSFASSQAVLLTPGEEG